MCHLSKLRITFSDLVALPVDEVFPVAVGGVFVEVQTRGARVLVRDSLAAKHEFITSL